MIWGLLEFDTMLTIFHVFGAILGAGGAFASDSMFFSSIKDGKITKTELRFLGLGSKLVWAGLIALIFSGVLLFSMNPWAYLASSKFLAKMTIVAVVTANGAIFHYIHLPLLKEHADIPFTTSKKFLKAAPFILASGVVSFVSWVSTVVLGVTKNIPYEYEVIISVYAGIVVIAMSGGIFFHKRILHLKKETQRL